MRRLLQAVRQWWQGEYKPYDTPGVIGLYHEQHWTARACHSIIGYIQRHHWKIIMALVAVAGIMVTAAKR
jgi:hypothetical protein